jgi:hypothetical protein
VKPRDHGIKMKNNGESTLKDDIARKLAVEHGHVESSIVQIFRILTSDQDEDNPAEPLKLLEVNRDTSPSGIVPIAFGPARDVPFPSVIVEVTPDEFAMINRRELQLPAGWQVGEALYEAPGASSDVGR